MLHNFYEFIFSLIQNMGYMDIFLMMLIEASLLPFPSELPLMTIGILASEGTMNPFIGLWISLLAIFIGSIVNYFIWYTIGDRFFEHYGKYFFIKKHAYHEAKRLFAKNENFYTFFWRLIPLVRQLMSLPAGMVHMPFLKFICLSMLGSAIWHSIVITIGYFIGENKELTKTYLLSINIIFIILGCIILSWKYRKLLKKMIQHIQNSLGQ